MRERRSAGRTRLAAQRRLRRLIALGSALLAVVFPTTAGAKALHIRLHFAPVMTGRFVESIWASDGDVFIEAVQRGYGAAATEGNVVLNETTGQQTVLSTPNSCYPNGMGGGFVLFNCGLNVSGAGAQPIVALYSVTTRTWQAISDSPVEPCGDYKCGITAVGIGTDWIEYDNRCGDLHGCHAANHYLFQNLATGKVVGDPRHGATVVNLDSPSLTQKVCSSVAAPHLAGSFGVNGGPFGVGSITPDGAFALAAGGNAQQGATFALERCSSKLHQLLPVQESAGFGLAYGYAPAGFCQAPLCGPAINPRMVVWAPTAATLAGVLLPSLKAFTAGVPDDSSDLAELLATPHRLYVLDQAGNLWEAPTP